VIFNQQLNKKDYKKH